MLCLTLQLLGCNIIVMNLMEEVQDKVLSLLAEKIDDFYLGGGTALAKFYFQHRTSDDLDFFTRAFDFGRIQNVLKLLGQNLGKPVEPVMERVEGGEFVRLCSYFLYLREEAGIKIDFVEDYIKLIAPLKRVNGINVMSLEDIYLRKIYTVCGTQPQLDMTGRKTHMGRQEAKDFYDLYFLSHTFKGLSSFVNQHGTPNQIEGLIYWYRTYSRQNIKEGLADLKISKKVDFRQMEKHFKKEVDQLIEAIT